jgi:hypothetical protein
MFDSIFSPKMLKTIKKMYEDSTKFNSAFFGDSAQPSFALSAKTGSD